MLNVKSVEQVKEILDKSFNYEVNSEIVSIYDAVGRILKDDVISLENVPSFNRSTVDGYGIKASDSFGTSDAIPNILKLQGKVEMGKQTKDELEPNSCFYVPTGGVVPKGADAVEMLEYAEDYKDSTIGILKPIAPNTNIIFKGDDLKVNDIVIHKGRKLTSPDIASLAAIGISQVEVVKPIKVGIISTGDELVKIEDKVEIGQVRNINSVLLSSLLKSLNVDYYDYGIIKDDENALSLTIDDAINKYDMVIISGGSSAGEKDVTAKLLEAKGELLFHGIAIKPGKPTMAASINNKAVFGLAGHPLAVLFTFIYFVKPLIKKIMQDNSIDTCHSAILTETIDSNNGRTSIVGLKLEYKDNDLYATPIITKSGLITSLREVDGYTIIDRSIEGVKAGSRIGVYDVF